MDRQHGLGLDEIVPAARRRAPLVAGVAAAGGLLALALAAALPPVYSATAKILVESPQIPDALARSTVTAPAARRLELIEQRLMARETLLAVAASFDLHADRPDMSPGETVAALREATAIEPITVGSRRAPEIAAFTITYRAPDPALAAAVANDLVARVLEQNRAQRTARATETNAFFKDEIARLGAAIAAAERRIGAFKAEHVDRLPDGEAARQQELLEIEERRAQRARRRAALEAQRRRLAAGPGGEPGAGHAPPPEAEELAERHGAPAATDPEVRALGRRIGALDGRILTASALADPEPVVSRADRAGARRAKVIGSYLALLEQRDAADRERQAALEAAIEAAPAVELALARLHRRLEDLEERRRMAVGKQAEAEIGERLEANRQAERFEVIEPAERPAEPEAPNRRLVAAGGLAASLALGLGLAALAEATSRTVHGPLDLERRTGLRPVVVVPWIGRAAERRRRRRAMLAGLALAAGLPLLLALADRQGVPLPAVADGPISWSGLDGLMRALDGRGGG